MKVVLFALNRKDELAAQKVQLGDQVLALARKICCLRWCDSNYSDRLQGPFARSHSWDRPLHERDRSFGLEDSSLVFPNFKPTTKPAAAGFVAATNASRIACSSSRSTGLCPP
jgi:hypothetical protein